jgi:pimeloyl-ACP methyl ester carboxylesterase
MVETVQVNGVRLEVQRLPAPASTRLAPIVFLHEGLGSVAMWRDWPATVCARAGRAGIVYSRRGYGQSDAVPDVRGAGRLAPDYMYREALDVLPELLAALDVDRPVLLGHSDGGTIALLHASHLPVTACVVMAPHVIVEDVSVKSIDEARVAYESGALRERLQRYHADVDGAFWQWNDIWLAPAFRGFDIRAECRRIRAPVLAIQGVDDPYGTLQQIDDIAPTLGPFSKCVLHACGHSPQRDQPDLTREHIAQFLAPLP